MTFLEAPESEQGEIGGEESAEDATPKCAALACGVFRAEGSQDAAASGKTFTSS